MKGKVWSGARALCTWRRERHDRASKRVVVADGIVVEYRYDERELRQVVVVNDWSQQRQLVLVPRVARDVERRLLAGEGDEAR